MKKFITSLLVLFVLQLTSASGQKNEKFSIEQIKQQCAALAIEKRARLSVTRFSVTTSTNSADDAKNRENARQSNNLAALSTIFGRKQAPQTTTETPTLGDNLTTMLTDALQQVNCFRILESLNNNKDLTGEIDAGDSKYSSKKTPKAGKQLGAQIVVTGEIIEYSVKDHGSNVMGVGSNKKTVKLGFNLKLINPETRDVIVSKIFRVETKSATSVSVFGVYSKTDSDPAVAAVMDDGVGQAVQYLARMRDSLNITADGKFAGNGNSDGSNEIEVDLGNANYTSFSAFADILSSMHSFKSMDKTLSNGVGTYTVTMTGSADKFTDELSKKLGAKYEIITADGVKIEVKVK